jgi:hypothetical protein
MQHFRKYATLLELLLGSGSRNSGSTVGRSVFFVVRSEAISLYQSSGREPQGAWHQDELIGCRQPVVK